MIKVVSGFEPTFNLMLLPKRPARKRLHSAAYTEPTQYPLASAFSLSVFQSLSLAGSQSYRLPLCVRIQDSVFTRPGDLPYAGLVLGTDGNFYGTATQGGAHTDGTVFKITSGGTLTTLHSFDFTDGYAPQAPLVHGTDERFYGTTNGGGADSYGTVFRITSGGTLATLHSFDSTDGTNPYGGLLQVTSGTFYGTTLMGGTNRDGTVFSLAVGLGPFVETVPPRARWERPSLSWETV